MGAEGVEPSCSKAAGLSPLCLPISPRAPHGFFRVYLVLSAASSPPFGLNLDSNLATLCAATTAAAQMDKPKRRAHGTGLKEVSPGHWKLRVRDPATSRQVYKTVIATGRRGANRALADFDAEVRAGKFKPARAQKAEAKAGATKDPVLSALWASS